MRTAPVRARTLTRFPAMIPPGQGRARRFRVRSAEPDRIAMLDIVFIAGALAFFGLAEGYAVLCERL